MMDRCPDDCKPKDRTVQKETPRRVLSGSKKTRPTRARKVEPVGLVDVTEDDEDEDDDDDDDNDDDSDSDSGSSDDAEGMCCISF